MLLFLLSTSIRYHRNFPTQFFGSSSPGIQVINTLYQATYHRIAGSIYPHKYAKSEKSEQSMFATGFESSADGC
jgi:hypothetical protein